MSKKKGYPNLVKTSLLNLLCMLCEKDATSMVLKESAAIFIHFLVSGCGFCVVMEIRSDS
jgi:hypothetical protein